MTTTPSEPTAELGILDSIKKTLGVLPENKVFDTDIIMHINSAIADLNQLGIGPELGFEVEDESQMWVDLLGDEKRYNAAKTYIYLQTKLKFDPPEQYPVINAMKEEISKCEWRLAVARDTVTLPPIVEVVVVSDPESVYDAGLGL